MTEQEAIEKFKYRFRRPNNRHLPWTGEFKTTVVANGVKVEYIRPDKLHTLYVTFYDDGSYDVRF